MRREQQKYPIWSKSAESVRVSLILLGWFREPPWTSVAECSPLITQKHPTKMRGVTEAPQELISTSWKWKVNLFFKYPNSSVRVVKTQGVKGLWVFKRAYVQETNLDSTCVGACSSWSFAYTIIWKWNRGRRFSLSKSRFVVNFQSRRNLFIINNSSGLFFCGDEKRGTE